MNLFGFLTRQLRWSNNTFGSGPRFKGNMEHIRRELAEIEANPSDPVEYADVIILACDTAMRQGITPHQLCKALEEKQLVNFGREWNLRGDDEPAEHKPVRKCYFCDGSGIVGALTRSGKGVQSKCPFCDERFQKCHRCESEKILYGVGNQDAYICNDCQHIMVRGGR